MVVQSAWTVDIVLATKESDVLEMTNDKQATRTRGFEVVESDKKKSTVDIKLPIRADDGSAGYDFYSPQSVEISPGEKATIWTDVKSYMGKDEVLKIYPRSSMGIKFGVSLANTTGIIDSSYYENPSNDGNIGICIINHSEDTYSVSEGDRIGQGIFQKYLIADNDDVLNAERLSGIGHSGK